MTIEQIASTLLVWIASHSSYKEAGQLPAPPIVLMSAQDLKALVRTRAGMALAEGKADDWRVHGYFSLEDEDSGTIYLVRPADTPGADRHFDPADNPIFRERLLHELVHYAQHATGAHRDFKCSAMRELAAYTLGGVYLQQRSVPDPLPDRMFMAFWTSRC